MAETFEQQPVTGAFVNSLKRNNKQIRADRADSIAENAMTFYRRRIEDLTMQMRQLQRDRENMLDLSPSDAQSLKLASDFNAEEFVNSDISIGVKLREIEIKLDIAKSRYEYLFSETQKTS